MGLVFFNTLTRQKERFHSIHPGEVRLYTCGPTVYDFAHIGNFRTYVFEDVLRRWLSLSGYRVTQVMNLTDVDDKTIQGSSQKKLSLHDYTQKYIDFFFEDLDKLGIERAEHYPRATEHIPQMVEIIETLLEKEAAYRGEDGSVYFNIAKFPTYGQLAHIEVEELKAGARVSHDEYDKEQASDFALWKAWDLDDGDVFWETSLGKGRPGWHIECSAMSMKYLGSHFDIHTGGVDNIFPHHQNEIAQSELYSGNPFVNYWIHAEHLIVDGRKMSKSLGNFYTIRDVLAKGFPSYALRYFYVSSHYRNKLNFTFHALQGAQSSVERIRDFVQRLRDARGTGLAELPSHLEEAQNEFKEAMDDDLNTPRAVACVHELINALNLPLEQDDISRGQAQDVADFLFYTDKILNLNLGTLFKPETLSDDFQALIEDREKARIARDFRKADQIRQSLLEKGLLVEDTPAGPRWKFVH